MCIRDSFHTAHGAGFGVHGGFPKLFRVHFTQALVPLDLVPCAQFLHDLVPLGIGEGVIVAVSYTHLAVYKRQSQTCPPRYEFSDGLVTHRLWVVNDTVAISALQEDFAGRKLYIAAGHHRYETGLRYRD